jgi:hypothetical protein
VTVVVLKNSDISEIFSSAILAAAGVREEEVAVIVLSASESFLVSSSACGLVEGRSWTVSPTMEHRMEMVQRAVEKDIKRLEGKSEK